MSASAGYRSAGSSRRFYRGLVVLVLCNLAACAQLQPRPELPLETALPPGDDGPLDRIIAPAEAGHPGESAFRLVTEGPEAFVIRVRSAMLAARSLDVQTYIWQADDTGIFLAHSLLEAADRGVKVRLMLDDMDARTKNRIMAALAAHPNIHVRTFNPFRSRGGVLGLIGEGVRNFKRVNRRMHNKSWIADNRIAVVGGRNIGDEYFNASPEMNFVDLDFAMIGGVVREASLAFDWYWNSAFAYPMELLDSDGVNGAELQKLRAELESRVRAVASSRYAAALSMDDAVRRLVEGDWTMEWSSQYSFVADDPLKVTMKKQDAENTHVGTALLSVVEDLQADLTVVSPYFVPGERLTSMLVDAGKSGKRVRVLTNSLAANDVAAVHGGYARYRKPLLAGGIELWELKPYGDAQVDSSLFGSSGASLHTKALVADGKIVFVGSYNLDPRSIWLNCEQGVLVENAALAAQLGRHFSEQVGGGKAWQVRLEGRRLRWSDGIDSYDSDPHASFMRRFQSWLTRLLGIEAQL